MEFAMRKLVVRDFQLGELVGKISDGDIRIPGFQREYVWGKKQTISLLDSMSQQFPIGTFFLWKAPAEHNGLIRPLEYLQQPRHDPDADHEIILDGQQRLTALYAVASGIVMSGDDYSRCVVDLSIDDPEKTPFLFRKARIDNQRWIRVRDILNEDKYEDVYENLKDRIRRRRLSRIHKALSTYPFSVVYVDETDLEKAIDIFERINQSGRRLSRFDLVAANVYGGGFDLRQKVEEEIADPIASRGFGRITNDIIPQALVMNLERAVTFKEQINLTASDVDTIWKDTVESIMEAVGYLRDNLGVARRVYFLPYDQIIPVLAHFYFFRKGKEEEGTKNEKEQKSEIQKWFWRVTFGERYGDTTQGRMQQDGEWIRRLVKDGEDLNLRFPLDIDYLIDNYMNQRSAIRNGVLCVLNLQNPTRFDTGESIQLNDDYFSKLASPEKHHIFPLAYLEKKGMSKRQVHRLLNFCFIPRKLNASIGETPPSKYLKRFRKNYRNQEEFNNVMNSHFISVNDDSAVWDDNYDTFLKERATLLLHKAQELAGDT